MGKIIEQDGFKVIIRTNDHDPPHVHVYKSGIDAKLSISNTPNLLKQTRMKLKDLDKAIEIVSQNHGLLEKEWKKIHG